jgi:hypothetical protein
MQPAYQPPSTAAADMSFGGSKGFTLARKEEAEPVLPGGAYLRQQQQQHMVTRPENPGIDADEVKSPVAERVPPNHNGLDMLLAAAA